MHSNIDVDISNNYSGREQAQTLNLLLAATSGVDATSFLFLLGLV